MASFGGKATLVADVVGVFLADTPTMLGRLRKAARAGDADEVAAAAHAIKGAAGLFSQGRRSSVPGAWKRLRAPAICRPSTPCAPTWRPPCRG